MWGCAHCSLLKQWGIEVRTMYLLDTFGKLFWVLTGVDWFSFHICLPDGVTEQAKGAVSFFWVLHRLSCGSQWYPPILCVLTKAGITTPEHLLRSHLGRSRFPVDRHTGEGVCKDFVTSIHPWGEILTALPPFFERFCLLIDRKSYWWLSGYKK